MLIYYLFLTTIISKSCLIFYTGGSNIMPINIYSNFLSEFNIDIYKIPFEENNNADLFIKTLKNKYNSVNLIGHSSGCVRLLNNCNNNIDKVILLDPVKTPYWDSFLDFNYLEKLLIINAGKSYKWNYLPPFIPFIPFFEIKINDIKINNNKCETIYI